MTHHPIRYRAFYLPTKEMLDVLAIEFGIENTFKVTFAHPARDGYREASCDDVEIMQFLGMQDKNGKDIYVGDVARWDYTFVDGATIQHTGIVDWRIGELCVDNIRTVNAYPGGLVQRHKSPYRSFHLMAENRTDWEVLGNIWENSDLLESTAASSKTAPSQEAAA